MSPGKHLTPPSIKTRLVQMQLFVALVAIVFAVLVFLIADIVSFSGRMDDSMRSVSQLLSYNLKTSLSFSDAEDATEILRSLEDDPFFVAGYLFDSENRLFAKWTESEDVVRKNLKVLTDKKITLAYPYIYYRHEINDPTGRSIGRLIIQSDFQILVGDIIFRLLAILAIFGGSVGAAFILSNFMHRSITKPIENLVKTARGISNSSNYSLRVENVGEKSPQEILMLTEEFNKMLGQIEHRDSEIQKSNEQLEKMVEERTQELQDAQRIAIHNAHAAGMAEIATGILHNIGNLINSVGISAYEMGRSIKKSKLGSMGKANNLLLEHRTDLPSFFSEDSRAKMLPDLYAELHGSFEKLFLRLENESDQIIKQIESVKEVIKSQQDYARGSAFLETADLVETASEVIDMQKTSLGRQGVQVELNVLDRPMVILQRVKFAHILVNLLKNAKEAMENNLPDQKIIKVEVGTSQVGYPYLSVSDQGTGIKMDDFEKIFSHGFTTKAGGHGFGLHFCFNSMTEMRGGLTAQNNQDRPGATFRLIFSRP